MTSVRYFPHHLSVQRAQDGLKGRHVRDGEVQEREEDGEGTNASRPIVSKKRLTLVQQQGAEEIDSTWAGAAAAAQASGANMTIATVPAAALLSEQASTNMSAANAMKLTAMAKKATATDINPVVTTKKPAVTAKKPVTPGNLQQRTRRSQQRRQRRKHQRRTRTR